MRTLGHVLTPPPGTSTVLPADVLADSGSATPAGQSVRSVYWPKKQGIQKIPHFKFSPLRALGYPGRRPRAAGVISLKRRWHETQSH